MKRLFASFFVLSLGLGLIYLYLQSPSHDRVWAEDFSRLSEAVATDDTVTITNVRDWQYSDSEVVERVWLDEVVINPADITEVWFVVTPFGATQLAGHTFLTFELVSGEAYSFSIEARREADEAYSAPVGLFRQFELIYVWSTERDALTRRIIKDAEALRLHRLELSVSDAQTLFKTVVAATEQLAQEPRFYNTLTANCTNLLAKTINARYPDTIPYHYSWNLPGNSDEFLINQGYIATPTSTEQTIAAAGLQQHVPSLLPFIHKSPLDFSVAVRKSLGGL